MSNQDDKPKNDDWGMTMPHINLGKDKNAGDFSDEFAPDPYSPKQASSDDGWGMTQQNFNLPQDQSSPADFDKTTPNINLPKDVWQDQTPANPYSQSAGDEWGMTTPNINLSPNQQNEGWGATAPNINLPQENNQDNWGIAGQNAAVPRPEKRDDWAMPTPVFRKSEGEKIDNLPKHSPLGGRDDSPGFDKTMQNFNLSEATQPMPSAIVAESAPTEPSAKPPSAAKPKSSMLIYALFGLIALFFFGIVGLTGVYFLFLNKPTETARTVDVPKEEPSSTTSSPANAPLSTAPLSTAPEANLPKSIELKGAMVLVPAGEFTMGSDTDADESKPAHKVTLPAYYIDKTEVTNAEYKAFCDATKKTYPPNPHLEKDYFLSRPNAPVVGVSFADAKAYADWAGKRLPTEEEWEKAASWDAATQTKREFPWGNDFQKNNVAFGIAKISDVGKFSGGASPSGAMDMAGNVLEWVDAFFQPYPNGTSTNPEFGEKNRVVRGGHFASKSNESLKTTKRIYIPPDVASGEDDEKLVAAIIGFRCAVSADAPTVKDALPSQSK